MSRVKPTRQQLLKIQALTIAMYGILENFTESLSSSYEAEDREMIEDNESRWEEYQTLDTKGIKAFYKSNQARWDITEIEQIDIMRDATDTVVALLSPIGEKLTPYAYEKMAKSAYKTAISLGEIPDNLTLDDPLYRGMRLQAQSAIYALHRSLVYADNTLTSQGETVSKELPSLITVYHRNNRILQVTESERIEIMQDAVQGAANMLSPITEWETF